jgi:hypothetical protein
VIVYGLGDSPKEPLGAFDGSWFAFLMSPQAAMLATSVAAAVASKRTVLMFAALSAAATLVVLLVGLGHAAALAGVPR